MQQSIPILVPRAHDSFGQHQQRGLWPAPILHNADWIVEDKGVKPEDGALKTSEKNQAEQTFLKQC